MPSNNSWKQTDNVLSIAARSNFGIAYFSNYVYVAGGLDDTGTNVDRIESIRVGPDGTFYPAQQVGVLPAIRGGMASVQWNDFMFVFGGFVGSTKDDVWSFRMLPNGQIGPVKILQTLPAPRTVGTAIVSPEGYVYFVGGLNGTVAAEVFCAKIIEGGNLGPWKSVTPLPVAKRNVSLAVHGGYLYCLGGFSTSTSDEILSIPMIGNGDLGPSWKLVGAMTTARQSSGAVKHRNKVYVCSTGVSPESITLLSGGQVGLAQLEPGPLTATSSSTPIMIGSTILYLGGLSGPRISAAQLLRL